MRPTKYSKENLIELIKKEEVVTIGYINSTMGCSTSTLFRLLEQIEYYTSYNCLRKYITLKETPYFSQYGLWEYDNAFFSKWGGIQPTIKNIVDNSPMGLSVKDIANMLKVRVNNQLQKLLKKNDIIRDRQGRFQIYFSADPSICEKQMDERRENIMKKPKLPHVTRKELIQILLTIIEHYNASCEEVYDILNSKGLKFHINVVKWLFAKLDDKKNDD